MKRRPYFQKQLSFLGWENNGKRWGLIKCKGMEDRPWDSDLQEGGIICLVFQRGLILVTCAGGNQDKVLPLSQSLESAATGIRCLFQGDESLPFKFLLPFYSSD